MTLPVPWNWPPIVVSGGGPATPVTSNDVSNLSTVAGANVTNALDSLQGEISGVSSTTVSNLSTVTGANVTAALNTLQGEISANTQNAFLNSFVKPPASPNALDFSAALATNPDLAANGFLVHLQNSPWTTLTRVGDVDMFDPNPPGANTYRSTLMGGLLYCQFPIGVGVAITKQASSNPTGYTLKTHAWLTRLFDATNATAGFMLSWYIAGLANPAGAAQYGAAGTQIVYAGILNQHWEITQWVVGNFPVTNQNVNVGTDFGDVVNYLRLGSNPGAIQPYAIRAGTPISFLEPAAPYSSSITLPAQRAGLLVNNGTAQFCVIDFIRFLPLTQFP